MHIQISPIIFDLINNTVMLSYHIQFNLILTNVQNRVFAMWDIPEQTAVSKMCPTTNQQFSPQLQRFVTRGLKIVHTLNFSEKTLLKKS